ncbi:hypothetical protein MYVA_1440 [Mycolicibacterium vaccae 95051]|nr:hypothetical protein MYVA_1440 [Mycolicibacterium vaccae 95051]
MAEPSHYEDTVRSCGQNRGISYRKEWRRIDNHVVELRAKLAQQFPR